MTAQELYDQYEEVMRRGGWDDYNDPTAEEFAERAMPLVMELSARLEALRTEALRIAGSAEFEANYEASNSDQGASSYFAKRFTEIATGLRAAAEKGDVR